VPLEVKGLKHFSKTLIVIFVSAAIVELATTNKGAHEIAFVGLATIGRLFFGRVGTTGPTLAWIE
jgi:hypothetical protein